MNYKLQESNAELENKQKKRNSDNFNANIQYGLKRYQFLTSEKWLTA